MEPGPSSYSLIALVLGDLESRLQRTRRNQVRSTSERSRALGVEGIAGSNEETEEKRQGKRLVVLRLVPFPSSSAGGCVDWLLPVDDVRSI